MPRRHRHHRPSHRPNCHHSHRPNCHHSHRPSQHPSQRMLVINMAAAVVMLVMLGGCGGQADLLTLAANPASPVALGGTPLALDEARVDKELRDRFNTAVANYFGNRDGGNGGGSGGDDTGNTGITNPLPTSNPDDSMMPMNDPMMSNDWKLGDYRLENSMKFEIPGELALNCKSGLCPATAVEMKGGVILNINFDTHEVALNGMDLHKYENGQSKFSVTGWVKMKMPTQDEIRNNPNLLNLFHDNAKADMTLTTPGGMFDVLADGNYDKDVENPEIYNTEGSFRIGDGVGDSGFLDSTEYYEGDYYNQDIHGMNSGGYNTLPPSEYIDERHSLGIFLHLKHEGTDKDDPEDDTFLFNDGFNFPHDPPPSSP